VATVFIPTMLLPLTDGTKKVTFEASNVREIVDGLESLYPGMRERLVEDGRVRPNISVAIDGELTRLGLIEKVGDNSEIHFVPAIGGGAAGPEC